ncbi:uncharacterized protein ISCGN_018868 [Ixodes scapularis]
MDRSAVSSMTAALSRGEAVRGDVPNDYAVILPTLPTGEAMKCSLVLHADTRGRPYRAEDFVGPLNQVGVREDVAGLGAFQMGHVWLLKLHTASAKEKLLREGTMLVKGRSCLVIDPEKRELKVKVHWVAFDVTADALRRAFEPYGEVKGVTREKWRIEGLADVDSTTVIVRMVLREGVTPESLPHQLRLYGGPLLVVVPGRAPVCLRCRRTGHIRRDCRVPRCEECRAFGHEASDCDEVLNLELDSEKIPVVAARRLGKTTTAMLTFDSDRIPRSVLYGRRYMRVYPYKPKAVTCTNCHRLGHKPDICPNASWNCDGLSKRAAELRAKFHDKPEEKPDVILLQETNARTINFFWIQGDSSAAASFDGFLQSALKEATNETRVEQDAPTPDLRLLGLWAKRLQAIQRYRNGLRTPYARRAITRATVEAKIYAKQLDSSRWLDFSASLSEKTSVKRLWAVSRTLLGKRKEKGATSAMALKMNKTDEQLANMAGDLSFPQPDSASDIPSPYDMEILTTDDGLDRPFTLGELEWALHCTGTGSGHNDHVEKSSGVHQTSIT